MDTNQFNELCCSILGMSQNGDGMWVSPAEELQWLCTELNFSLDYGYKEPYKFHSDWRWLMEVVDVIETTDWDIRWHRSWDRISSKWGEILIYQKCLVKFLFPMIIGMNIEDGGVVYILMVVYLLSK